MEISEIRKIAAEEYDKFVERCLQEAVSRHDGDKVSGLNEMQGFDFPDSIGVGEEFSEYCEENGLTVPDGAIGGTIIHSGDACYTEYIFPTMSEKQVREMARGLYE